MIATILASSRTFHAVKYNEMKVAEGSAELLELKNIDTLVVGTENRGRRLQDYLVAYSSMNTRIKNAQFHVAISCKGHEYSFPELVEIAHEYLRQMGYDNEGQPLLIYAHHDTDNNHIHIITSRVAPDGHKINDSMEKKRSLSIINGIMNQREGMNVSEDVAQALNYHYGNISQFRAILESEGYECYEDGDELRVKRGGEVIDHVKLSIIRDRISTGDISEERRKRLRAYLLRYRDHCANKEELNEQMHRLFGVSLVFVGKADAPYGYFIVDHHEKAVWKGGAVLSLKALLQFKTAEERFSDIDTMVRTMLEDNAYLTTKELNAKLRRQFGTRLTPHGIGWGNEVHHLPEEIMDQLKENDAVAWLQSFNPSSEVECAILLKFRHMEPTKQLRPTDKDKKVTARAAERVRGIMDRNSDETLKNGFFEAGMRIYCHRGSYYCVDIQDRCIFNMKDFGLDVERLNRLYRHVNTGRTPQQQQKPKVSGNGLVKAVTQQGGAGDENREYEVGDKEGYEQSIANQSRLSM